MQNDFYSATTEPLIQRTEELAQLTDSDLYPRITEANKIPQSYHVQHVSRLQNCFCAFGRLLTLLVLKIDQAFAIIFMCLIIILFTRLAIIVFNLPAVFFVVWLLRLSNIFVQPFHNFAPMIRYQNRNIELASLVTIVFYSFVIVIIRKCLKFLIQIV